MSQSPPDPVEAARRITAQCLDLGFALSGVTAASPSDRSSELLAWLQAGRHGSMDYLARNVDVRLDIRNFLPGAHSVIMVADQYAPRAAPGPIQPADGAARGRIARYAQGRDYHVVMKRRLHALCDSLRREYPAQQFRAFVDTAPVNEREHAARAGLGWIAKNSLLINPRQGSYLLLGGIATTLLLESPPDQAGVPDHCGTCTRCIDACPTGAITPYSVDASRCISYLTIERRAPIDPAFHSAIDDRIFGCDICQEVCPHNSPRPGSPPLPVPVAYQPVRESLDLLDMLGWTEDRRRRELASSAIKRARLDMLRRNAAIAAGNAAQAGHAGPRLRDRMAEIAANPGEPDMVRAAASESARRARSEAAGSEAAQ